MICISVRLYTRLQLFCAGRSGNDDAFSYFQQLKETDRTLGRKESLKIYITKAFKLKLRYQSQCNFCRTTLVQS